MGFYNASGRFELPGTVAPAASGRLDPFSPGFERFDGNRPALLSIFDTRAGQFPLEISTTRIRRPPRRFEPSSTTDPARGSLAAALPSRS